MEENVPTDFKKFAGLYTDKVYNLLMSYYPKAGVPREFLEMMRSYSDRKGQYRRPMYLLAWNLLYGGKLEDALLPAAVQQVSEDYFLMHDDWMDGNGLRRGKPAAHTLYGPVYAILAGDTVHVLLWKMANDVADSLGAQTRKRYMDKLIDIMMVTHIGQYYDIHLTEEKDITKFTKEDYYKSIHAKSAYYSIYGPMQCGAIIAGAHDDEIARIADYGVPAGFAFQIKDDILDCTSTEGVLGKSIGTDVKQGTKTLILWHAVQNASAGTLKRMREIYMKRPEDKTAGEISFVLGAFSELGSIGYAESEAGGLAAESLKSFEEVHKSLPESGLKNLARSAIGHAAIRKK